MRWMSERCELILLTAISGSCLRLIATNISTSHYLRALHSSISMMMISDSISDLSDSLSDDLSDSQRLDRDSLFTGWWSTIWWWWWWWWWFWWWWWSPRWFWWWWWSPRWILFVTVFWDCLTIHAITGFLSASSCLAWSNGRGRRGSLLVCPSVKIPSGLSHGSWLLSKCGVISETDVCCGATVFYHWRQCGVGHPEGE